MPIAGSKAGLYRSPDDRQGFDIPVVRQWQAIGNQQLSGTALYSELAAQAQPMQLSIGIGNTCGLTCQHCFLGYDSGAMSLTPLTRLMGETTTLVEQLGTRMICVADRDALTPKRSIPYFEHLAGLRQHYPDLKFGGITNGMALHQYVHDLARIRLDYLDISIDGPQHEHEQVRGAGTFDRVLTNLRLALKHQVADRVLVATTLTRHNDDATIRLILQLMREEGVQWFDISPLLPVKMQPYQLHKEDIVSFLDSLTQTLKPEPVSQPVNILMEIPTYANTAGFLPSLMERGWLVPQHLRQDRYGRLYQDIVINDRITVTLRPNVIPDYWWQNLRISADGYVVGGCEALTQADYADRAMGTIQTESITEIYPKTIAPGSPFHQGILDYAQTIASQTTCCTPC